MRIYIFFVFRKLFSKLEEILNSANNEDSQGGKIEEDNLIYELQFKPHQAELDVSAKAGSLTTRLERLENILGTNNEMVIFSNKYHLNEFLPLHSIYYRTLLLQRWVKNL